MRDLFACRDCHAIYAITRRQQPPHLAPSCSNCGCKFPPNELGDWLTYERAEPEWTVGEWLKSPSQIQSTADQSNNRGPNQSVPEPTSQGEELSVNSLMPSGRMRKLAALVPRT
jgi:hypothetical protein